MKIKTLLILCFAVGALTQPLIAQKKKDKPADTTPTTTTAVTPASTNDGGDLFEVQKKVLKQALRYGDFSTAAIALNYIVVLKPEQKEYKDTLALVYAELGANVQALSVAKDILATNPNNAPILEVAANSEESLGLIKEALEDYEKLFKLSGKTYHQYKVATMQYYLKRFGECAVTLNGLLGAKDVSTEKISMNLDRQQRQEVPLSAAVYNMRGMLALEVSDFKSARDNFNEALKILPDFALAKGNLTLTDKLEADKNGTATPPKGGNTPPKK
jgi:tetratricopeptide (TPR) repeat protein